jgi:hypothetical protein
MEKFDLKDIGIIYTVLDKDTEETCQVRVIDYAELKLVVGEFVNDSYKSLGSHMKEVLKNFKGFANSPYAITWYCVPKDAFELSHAIIQARREGNSIVVVEVLPTEDIDKHIQMR